MKIKNIEVSKDRSITIIDELFTFSEISGFETTFMSLPYEISNANSLEIQSISNKRLVHKMDQSRLENMKFFNKSTLPIIQEYIPTSVYTFWRSYVNVGIHSDQHEIHTDIWEPNTGITLLYYGNKTWDKNWGGSTLFLDDDCKDIIFTCSFIPGRLVIFDSSIPHTATSQHFSADPFRFTFATKFVLNTEIR
jgi:hypothetical protein